MKRNSENNYKRVSYQGNISRQKEKKIMNVTISVFMASVKEFFANSLAAFIGGGLFLFALIYNVFKFANYCVPKLRFDGKLGPSEIFVCTIAGIYVFIAVAIGILIGMALRAVCWNKCSKIEVQIKPDGDQEHPLQEIVISPVTRMRRAMHL